MLLASLPELARKGITEMEGTRAGLKRHRLLGGLAGWQKEHREQRYRTEQRVETQDVALAQHSLSSSPLSSL